MSKETSKPNPKKRPREESRETDRPNSVRTREELDDALEAGSNSGVSDRTVSDILAEVLARRKNAGL